MDAGMLVQAQGQRAAAWDDQDLLALLDVLSGVQAADALLVDLDLGPHLQAQAVARRSAMAPSIAGLKTLAQDRRGSAAAVQEHAVL